MNHDILKEVIFDQHEIIKKTKIVPRDYDFDLNANYVLIGLRRAGKSTLLYKIVKDLVEKGIEWNQREAKWWDPAEYPWVPGEVKMEQ